MAFVARNQVGRPVRLGNGDIPTAPGPNPNFVSNAFDAWKSFFHTGRFEFPPTPAQVKSLQDARIMATGIDPKTGKLIPGLSASAFQQQTNVDPNNASALSAWIAKTRVGVTTEVLTDFKNQTQGGNDSATSAPGGFNWWKIGAIGGAGVLATVLAIRAVK